MLKISILAYEFLHKNLDVFNNGLFGPDCKVKAASKCPAYMKSALFKMYPRMHLFKFFPYLDKEEAQIYEFLFVMCDVFSYYHLCSFHSVDDFLFF